jgi:hypothetical protein
LVAGFNNTYLGNFVGSFGPVPDESSTIRIGDLSTNGFGSAECYIGGIFHNFQPRSATVAVVTVDLTNDHLGWDVVVSPNEQQAPVQPVPRNAPQRRSAPQPAARPQHQAMLNDKVEKLQATVAQQQKQGAQQQKQIETLTAQLKEQAVQFTTQLKEQAAQIQKVSAQLEMNKPAPRVVENR